MFYLIRTLLLFCFSFPLYTYDKQESEKETKQEKEKETTKITSLQTSRNLLSNLLKIQNNALFFYSFLSAFEEVIATAGCFDEMIIQRLWNIPQIITHIFEFLASTSPELVGVWE